MKKKVIIVVLVLALLIISTAGIIVINKMLERTYDFEISTEEKLTSLLFVDACSSAPELNMGYKAIKAELADAETFFDTFVKTSQYYLYSVDSENKQTQGETGDYMFFKDNSYFFISVRDKMIYATELDSCFSFDSQYCTHVSNPFIDNNRHINGGYGFLDKNNTNYFTWSDAPGINSMDELYDYFKRITNVTCTYDSSLSQITVTVRQLDESFNPIEGKDTVCFKGNGDKIEVTYSNEG